jgi:fructokinase
MRIGIDVGGTKIEGLAMDGEGKTLWTGRVPTPKKDYGKVVVAIGALIDRIETDTGHRGSIGIATPGSISPHTGTMQNCNNVSMNQKPFQRDLEHFLGRDIRLANDADCFVLSEATDGAGRNAACVFGVIIGTGVGGGLFIHGRLASGPNANAGEWGHNPLPWTTAAEQTGPACYCGKIGCIETWLSGPALSCDHNQITGQEMTADAIAAAADTGDTDAIATLNRYTDRLSRALAGLVNILDPDVIVLGGGLSNLTCIYPGVKARWGDHIFADEVATELKKAQFGDASGVRGAAWLWNET